MNTPRKTAGLIAVVITAAAAVIPLYPLYIDTVSAADHLDAPKTMMNLAADITDVYAWHTGDGKVVTVLDFAGFTEIGAATKFDSTVLYGIHVDNTGDNVADHDVWVRFGQDSGGKWGVQITGLPGGEPVVSGAVDTVIDAGLGLHVWAGLRDDPFFFDLEGFKATAATGTLSFKQDRDTFAKTNVTSIVVEMSTDAVLGAGKSFRLWTSTRVRA